MTTEKFTLTCPQCGGTKFKATTAKPGPDTPLTCAGCGTSITLGAVKERIEQKARAAIEASMSGNTPADPFPRAPTRLKRFFGFRGHSR
ncbi:MAG: hypothetical protein WCP22_11110 [Chlamydiota bacterium]